MVKHAFRCGLNHGEWSLHITDQLQSSQSVESQTNSDPFPAPFHEPKIDIYQKEKTAICSTTGGYPQPEVTWSCRDHPEERERSLEHDTLVISEEDGTFTIRSTVNITGLQNVTCSVYNPTSGQTLSITKGISLSKIPGT